MPEQSKMEISLFSGMTILWNGTPILEHSARLNKPLELLALLLLRGDKKLTNEQLMDGLWESDEIENPREYKRLAEEVVLGALGAFEQEVFALEIRQLFGGSRRRAAHAKRQTLKFFHGRRVGIPLVPRSSAWATISSKSKFAR